MTTTNILVIDDDPVVRGTIRAVLEDEGYSVTCAEDGRRGLAAFRKSKPDLVVIDIIMPDKEGIETILELRSIWPEGPIIAISAGGRIAKGDLLELAKGGGADAVLAKPFEPEALLALVRARAGRP
jgi:DNA-binding response OmpR family regulator